MKLSSPRSVTRKAPAKAKTKRRTISRHSTNKQPQNKTTTSPSKDSVKLSKESTEPKQESSRLKRIYDALFSDDAPKKTSDSNPEEAKKPEAKETTKTKPEDVKKPEAKEVKETKAESPEAKKSKVDKSKLTKAEQDKWKEKLGEETLAKGLKNVESVGALQNLLNQRENAGLKVDKSFGPGTENAVKAAQKRLGMEPTGKFDATTRDKLLSAAKKPQNKTVDTKLPTGKGTEAVKKRIQSLLRQEHKRFGGQTVHERVDKRGRTRGKTIKRGTKEHHRGVFKRVGDFWRSVGQRLNGRNRKVPWSAAFISHIHKKAGAGSQFKASPAHSSYIRDSIQARKSGNKNAAYWGYRTKERAPQVGDMVAYSRQKGINYSRQPRHYKSHTDIVVNRGKGYIEVIGGNVGHSVTLRRIPTDANGKIIDKKKYFAVMAPVNLGK